MEMIKNGSNVAYMYGMNDSTAHTVIKAQVQIIVVS